MAIPKSLKRIDHQKAMNIIKKHSEGYWDGTPFNSDFIYDGRNKRSEMVRVSNICGSLIFEMGVVSN